MSEILNAFNNSWPFVQVVMLLALLGALALPFWLLHSWLIGREKLPPNVLLALRQDGDTLTLTVREGAMIPPTQLSALLSDHGLREEDHQRPN